MNDFERASVFWAVVGEKIDWASVFEFSLVKDRYRVAGALRLGDAGGI